MSNSRTESTTVTQESEGQRRNVQVSDETWRRVRVLAAQRDQTYSEIVEAALIDYAQRNAA